jgi:hypothetical protein
MQPCPTLGIVSMVAIEMMFYGTKISVQNGITSYKQSRLRKYVFWQRLAYLV